MPLPRRFTVSGRVQGVFFRDSTRRVAESLGLVGHAINLPNGDVDVVCYGDDAAMRKLAAWLAEGPPMARVDRVVEASIDDLLVEVPAAFRVG